MTELPPLRPAHVAGHVLRHRIDKPVHTSFGTMHERPALLLRIEDADGAHGWGEVWCNFPACGAEHRARLVETVLAIQSGEPGPIAQAIAGLDLTLWDLAARRAGQPLWQLLGGSSDEIGVYASGINPDRPDEMVAVKRAQGYRAFKLKIGFDEQRDLDNIQRVRDAAGSGDAVMVDANQAWDLATATLRMRSMERFALGWIEEPLRADRPWSEWRSLRQHAPTALSAGENVAGVEAFDALFAADAVQVVQPDVAKWGGISGTLPVIRRIQAQGLRHCPHYLGTGIGLLHSAHLLAATAVAGEQAWLEVDANDNPLRTLLCGTLNTVRDGRAQLGRGAGIGVEPDLQALRDQA